MNVRSYLRSEGYYIFEFPSYLRNYLMESIRLKCLNSFCDFENDLDKLILTMSDDDFRTLFSKSFRMFDFTSTEFLLEWVKNTISPFFGNRSITTNFVRPKELDKSLFVTNSSLDFYWRCVRFMKEDVGPPHTDYHFWCIDKLTNNLPFNYDESSHERWKLWIQLDGCTVNNSLQIIPKSHHEILDYVMINGISGPRPSLTNSTINKYRNAFVNLDSQFDYSCILFHDKLIHRGVINNDSHIRFSAELTLLVHNE